MKRLISLLAIIAILGVSFSSCTQKKKRRVKKVVAVAKAPTKPKTVAYQPKVEPVVEPVIEAQKYFIIGGSFEIKSNAEKFQATLIDLAYESEIFISFTGCYRVSYMGFSDKKEALRVLANERAKEDTQEVWLHIPKNLD
jgi:cell division protein FtsN